MRSKQDLCNKFGRSLPAVRRCYLRKSTGWDFSRILGAKRLRRKSTHHRSIALPGFGTETLRAGNDVGLLGIDKTLKIIYFYLEQQCGKYPYRHQIRIHYMNDSSAVSENLLYMPVNMKWSQERKVAQLNRRWKTTKSFTETWQKVKPLKYNLNPSGYSYQSSA